MNTLNFEYDTEYGFAFIQVDGKQEGDKLTVQCCLESSGEGLSSGSPYLNSIVMSDCGHDEGLCSEANEEAFKYWGENRCMKALFSACEENGLTVNP